MGPLTSNPCRMIKGEESWYSELEVTAGYGKRWERDFPFPSSLEYRLAHPQGPPGQKKINRRHTDLGVKISIESEPIRVTTSDIVSWKEARLA